MIIYHFSRGIDCITTHSIVHHVVAQFRWLNELRDGTLLLNLLIDAIKSLNDDVIADVIILFPDIFDYRHHDRLAQELKILLTSTTNIFSIIYYVLGCLTLSVPLQNEIHLEALELLENVPLKDAPYLITFLLKNVINFNESRENTIVKIRERLIQYHISNPKMPENEQISSINNCWSSIEFGIRYVKRVPEIIIKSVDFILFVLLYGIYDKSKLFKIISSFESPKKEATSLLYFDRIFTGIIMAHVENFLEFCDKLIRLKTACAIHFYKKSFLSLFTHLDKTVQDVFIQI
ncbi:hypothetical protein HZS_5946 [Henneguya salminicola]|nr:hypothetical protein HZS_5946 [Henneguya salminicola]